MLENLTSIGNAVYALPPKLRDRRIKAMLAEDRPQPPPSPTYYQTQYAHQLELRVLYLEEQLAKLESLVNLYITGGTSA